MKIRTLVLVALSAMLSINLSAQCTADAPLIVGPADQYAFRWCNGTSLSNIGLFFASSVNEYQFKRSSGANILTINPTGTNYIRMGAPDVGNYTNIASNGDLTFVGNADYLVSDNRYVFRNQADQDQGLFYSSSNQRYEFRDSDGDLVWQVGANSGDVLSTGGLTVGNTSATTPGTIRWNGTDLEGRIGGSWVSLTSSGLPGPAGPVGPAGPAGLSTLQAGYDGGNTINTTASPVIIAGNAGLLSTGTLGSGGIPEEGNGIRMMWYPGKAAFRVGQQALDGKWDDANIGRNSFAAGFNPVASGESSTAMGSGTTASASRATAMGSLTSATANNSTAMGSGTTASGTSSTAMGFDTRASGDNSTSIGSWTRASSYSEVALGIANTEYTPVSTSTFNNNDRLLVVGNGVSPFARSNALVMLKNGNTAIGNINPATNLEVGGSGTRTVRVSSTSVSDVRYELLRAGSGFLDWRIANSAGDLIFSRSTDDLATATEMLRLGAGIFRPGTDNSMQLGGSSIRWSTVFAANGTINTSDARDKTNIQELSYGLEDIRKLRPVSFNWINDQDHGTKLGLIAQDLQQVLPEVVRDWDYTEDEENGIRKVEAARLGVYYSDIIPVLIKGIQELDQQVQDSDSEALQSRVEELEAENAAIRAQLDAILDRLNAFDGDLQQCCLSHSEGQQPGSGSTSPSDLPSLGQNIPNPFSGSTLISYYLPQGTSRATLSVSARNGSPVASFELNEPGFGQVSLDGSRLAAGIYFYSLMVDGRLIETRQMVVMQ